MSTLKDNVTGMESSRVRIRGDLDALYQQGYKRELAALATMILETLGRTVEIVDRGTLDRVQAKLNELERELTTIEDIDPVGDIKRWLEGLH